MQLNKNLLIKFVVIIIVGWSIILGTCVALKYYQLEINLSNSMYKRLWVTHLGDMNLKRGDFVVIRFHDYRMKNLTDYELVVKQIGGIAGDKILVKEQMGYTGGVGNFNKITWNYVLPDGIYPIYDLLSGYHFTPLTTKNMVIPKGYYFLHGQHHPSFDSRYKEFGLISKRQIIGKTYPIF